MKRCPCPNCRPSDAEMQFAMNMMEREGEAALVAVVMLGIAGLLWGLWELAEWMFA